MSWMSWVSSWWHKNTGPTFECHGASFYDMGQKFWMSWLCPTVCEQDDPFHVYEDTVYVVLRSPPRACTSNAGKTGSHLKWSLVNVTPCENTRRRLCPCLSAWSSGYHMRFMIVRSRVQSPACAHCFLAWTLSFVITRTKKRRFLLGYKISRSSG